MRRGCAIFDRAIRIVGGIVLITLAALGKIGVWGYIGIVPLFTGMFGFCPAYRLIGLTRCPLAARRADETAKNQDDAERHHRVGHE